MILQIPNVAKLIAAVSDVGPGYRGAVDRVACDRSVDAGDLAALDAAALDALADIDGKDDDDDAARSALTLIAGQLGNDALTPDEIVAEIDEALAARAELNRLADVAGVKTGELAGFLQVQVDGLARCYAAADLRGEHTPAELDEWIGLANAKIFAVDALERQIKDLEFDLQAAIDTAIAAVDAADAAKRDLATVASAAVNIAEAVAGGARC